MTKEKKVATPVIEPFLSTVLITAETASKILYAADASSGDTLKNEQKVVAVGPHVKPENGMNIKPGDKVLLNLSILYTQDANGKSKLKPGASIGEYICFDNETGKFDGYVDKDSNTGYFLVNANRLLCKV